MQHTTSEVLDLAADYIQQHGWKKGPGWDYFDGGAVCLEGALAAVLEIPSLTLNPVFPEPMLNHSKLQQCDAFKAVREFLAVEQPWRFNDAEGTTREDVIAVLRAAAMVERAREDQLVLFDVA